MLAILVVSGVLAFTLGYLAKEISLREEQKPSAYGELPPIAAAKVLAGPAPREAASARRLTMKLVAVDSAGKGAIADLVAAITPGNGSTWIRIDRASPLINPDTQTSLRNAVEIVAGLLNFNLSSVDVFYGIIAESNLVGGRSAGAAIGVATIALFRNESLRGDVLITGTIESDGRIGEVGMILPKAVAAKEEGYRLLLVPPGESEVIQQKEECREEVIGNTIFRECHSMPVKVSVAKEAGIEVREVSNIMEAYALMKAK